MNFVSQRPVFALHALDTEVLPILSRDLERSMSQLPRVVASAALFARDLNCLRPIGSLASKHPPILRSDNPAWMPDQGSADVQVLVGHGQMFPYLDHAESVALVPLRSDGLVAGVLVLGTVHPITMTDLRSIRALQKNLALEVGSFVAIQRLRYLAEQDNLSGCLRPDPFAHRLDRAVRAQIAVREPISVIFADLNSLKLTNDKLGHDVGDKLIAAAGSAMLKSLRGGDVVGRKGGDEFVILTMSGSPALIAERLRQLVVNAVDEVMNHEHERWLRGDYDPKPDEPEKAPTPDPLTLGAGCAAGWATYPADLDALNEVARRNHYDGPRALSEALVKLADERMYASKVAQKADRASRMAMEAEATQPPSGAPAAA